MQWAGAEGKEGGMTPFTRWVEKRRGGRCLLALERVYYLLAVAGIITGVVLREWRIAVPALGLLQAGMAVDMRLQVIAFRRRTTQIIAMFSDDVPGTAP